MRSTASGTSVAALFAMRTSKVLIPSLVVACVALSCGGSPPPQGQPAVITPDGTVAPLPTEDGELKEGETTIKQEGPGPDKKIEVDVEDD